MKIFLVTTLLAALSASSFATELYVDAVKGDDAYSGTSRTQALRTIQHAADIVKPGDTITITAGVYFERPVFRQGGTKDRPVTVRADVVERGRVVISAATPEIRRGELKWKLEDEKLHLYSVPLEHNPARILYSGTDLMPYSHLRGLKNFTLLQECPGPRHGFFFVADERKLYVRLHPEGKYGSTDPNLHVMSVAPPNAPGYNGHKISRPEHANLTVDVSGSAWIVFDGITFETPSATAIFTRGDDVTVRNCWFEGCRFGVFGAGEPGEMPSRVIVENCYYHHFPAFNDVADLINEYRNTEVMTKYSIFWWHRKGSYCDRELMKNYETGIAGGIGKDWHLRYNMIRNAFEGLSTWGNSWSENLRVYGNVFDKVVDNAIEAENHAKNMRVYDNVFIDVFEPVSWQPLDGEPWPGPVYVYRNLIYATPEFQQLWPWRPGCFKLGASDRNWTKEHMGSVPLKQLIAAKSKRFVKAPGDGFLVFNNTVIMPHSNLLNTPGISPLIDGPLPRELVNFRFFNNILVTHAFHRLDTFSGSLIEFYHNLVIASKTDAQSKISAGLGGQVLSSIAELKLADPDTGDFRLTPDSPAIGKGTQLIAPDDAMSDIGAIPFGKEWPAFKVGPQAR